LILAKNKLIKKAKGVKADYLKISQYAALIQGQKVKGLKTTSKKDYLKGTLDIYQKKVNLNAIQTIKRAKRSDFYGL